MKLRWFGTAAVMLESKGFKLLFDPFLGMPVRDDLSRRTALKKAFRSADCVFVTHGHFDHIYNIPELYGDVDIGIYATKTPCEMLKAHGAAEDKLRLIAPEDKLDIGPFSVTVYQGRHCRFDLGVVRKMVFKGDTALHLKKLAGLLRLNKKYPENSETLFFEIEAEGRRVQLMGSMGIDADSKYPTFADVLILPFQGTGDPSATVKPIIDKLLPQTINLDHYDDAFPPLSTQIETDSFVSELFGHRIPAAALKTGENYII